MWKGKGVRHEPGWRKGELGRAERAWEGLLSLLPAGTSGYARSVVAIPYCPFNGKCHTAPAGWPRWWPQSSAWWPSSCYCSWSSPRNGCVPLRVVSISVTPKTSLRESTPPSTVCPQGSCTSAYLKAAPALTMGKVSSCVPCLLCPGSNPHLLVPSHQPSLLGLPDGMVRSGSFSSFGLVKSVCLTQ